jgi:hypothetical protein
MYRPPRDCPVCTTRLHITELGCPSCGTGLSGEFEPCEFCGLEAADRDLLRVFLVSRGNMKELERHLGVSYPTARARFDDLLTKLGLSPAADAPAPVAPLDDPDERATDLHALATLQAVAAGTLSVDAAREQLER